MLTTPYKWISQYLFGFFFAYGVYLPFWSIWFEGQGVSPSDIGILIGTGFATRCLSNMVLTPRLHKFETIIPALRWLSILSFIVIGCHLFISGSFWLMMLATIIFGFLCGPAMPLMDALTNYYNRLNILDYGRTRLWGSIAFIVGSTAVGFLVKHYGTDMIIYTAMVGFLFAIIISFMKISPAPVSAPLENSDSIKLSTLLKEPRTLRFLLLISLIQGSHAAFYSFSSIHWHAAGHSSEIIGFLWGLGVVAEISLFMYGKHLLTRFSINTLFTIASIGVMVRWGLTASTTNLSALIIIQLLHGVTFAMAHIAAIKYIQLEQESKTVPLQALYNAIPLGAFMAAMTAISGWGYQLWGANIFWLMAAMGFASLFVRLKQPQQQATTE
ncbi:3-phenylpropionate MFS transporter [Vibrio sp. SS-MA-C1-2]|uniref:3-phenylpropionate MFS transporter n=1 Tax=Vibrio sp. SS-MA-C1-2 TaxID=2908646 RepID=UPI001F25A5B6|nr:3-phenylpropionate MFS transporter [Vibrio sp. SS-MA-C1-2]UJF18573.1 3-phenylpropionate MFS transporter [Vibrio sp. SS-MA-C1-2]